MEHHASCLADGIRYAEAESIVGHVLIELIAEEDQCEHEYLQQDGECKPSRHCHTVLLDPGLMFHEGERSVSVNTC